MKKIVTILLVATVLAFLGAFGAFAALENTEGNKTLNIGIHSRLAQAQPPRDVVVVKCAVVATAPVTGALSFDIETSASSSSSGSPSVEPGGCAQELADLIDAGFEIENQSGGTFYTLERKGK